MELGVFLLGFYRNRSKFSLFPSIFPIRKFPKKGIPVYFILVSYFISGNRPSKVDQVSLSNRPESLQKDLPRSVWHREGGGVQIQ